MRTLLNIGEVAKMMHMSTSQIRYYERQGLIKPKLIDDNKYRLYDFTQIEILEIILLLKDLGMPLKEIRLLLEDDSSYDYQSILDESLDSVEKEMEDLKIKKEMLQDKKKRFLEFSYGDLEIKTYPDRIIKVVDDNVEENMQIKGVYDFISDNNIDYLNYDDDIYNIIFQDGREMMAIYTEDPILSDKLNHHTIEAGDFLCYTLKLRGYEDIPNEVLNFKRMASEKGIQVMGDLIYVEDLKTILYSRNHMFITLQMRIK